MIVSTHTLELEQGVSELFRDCHLAINAGDLEFAGTLLLEAMTEKPDDIEGWLLLCRFLIDSEASSEPQPRGTPERSSSRTGRYCPSALPP